MPLGRALGRGRSLPCGNRPGSAGNKAQPESLVPSLLATLRADAAEQVLGFGFSPAGLGIYVWIGFAGQLLPFRETLRVTTQGGSSAYKICMGLKLGETGHPPGAHWSLRYIFISGFGFISLPCLPVRVTT